MTGINPLKFYPIVFCTIVAACADFQEPQALDPRPYLGCYGGYGNELVIDINSLRVNEKRFDYIIEEHKVGLVLAISAIFSSDDNILQAHSSDRHFYRILDRSDGVAVRIVDQSARVFDLSKTSCL